MSKRHSAKYKIDRRVGENIWGRPKSPVNKRPFPPGQHGQNRRGKLSDYGTQLRAKQKLKGYYGNITEKQFRRTYKQADSMRGDTSENLIGLLESRLDAVVYRSKFVPTVFASRQFVNHGHVLVNGKKVNSRLTVVSRVMLLKCVKNLVLWHWFLKLWKVLSGNFLNISTLIQKL